MPSHRSTLITKNLFSSCLRAFVPPCLLLLAACTDAPPPASRNVALPARTTPRVDPVISSETWTYNGKPGKNIRTANYTIYTTQASSIIAARMPTFVEAALQNYTSSLGLLPPPPGQLETFIMSTRGEWERLTKQLMGDQASIYLQIQRGGYAAGGRGIYYDIGPSDTFSIASHEGWHQYTQRTFREGLPTWLEEGIATYMEGHRWEGATPRFLAWSNTERFDQLRSASAKGGLLSLQEIMNTSPQELLAGGGPMPATPTKESGGGGLFVRAVGSAEDRLLTYYAQIWALVHFLNEAEGGKYRPLLESLVSDAANGRLRAKLAGSIGEQAARSAVMTRRGPAVMLAYFGGDLGALSMEYSSFIGRIVRPGSRGLIVEGRSPIE
ncbi:MAG: hypothetical protein H7210_04285 [Pyrinomonadaceae bacterium]|nr:hypothetical protein [Phycisphaerales bacterium]